MQTTETFRAYRKKNREANRVKILDYLRKHPCMDCGVTDIVVLQFDHRRGTKRCNVGVLVTRGKTWKKVFEEIQKCDVVCANCHTRRTARDQGWGRAKNRFLW